VAHLGGLLIEGHCPPHLYQGGLNHLTPGDMATETVPAETCELQCFTLLPSLFTNGKSASQSDRHFRGRAGVELSPERSPRYERLPIGISDRGPPYFKRETWPSERRPMMDSYRPQYDDERPPPTRRDRPLSPPNGHAKRESESSLPSRLTDPEFTRVPMKSSLSAGALASPSPITHNASDPPWSSPLSLDALKRVSLPRSTSRSSIASTHESDRRSPGVASIPQPLSVRLPAGLPAKPQAAIDALANENRRADAKYGAKPVHSSVVSQSPMHAIEPEKVLERTCKRNLSECDRSVTGPGTSNRC
jgi:hypothetical protein